MHRVAQSFLDFVVHDQTVNHRFNGVALFGGELEPDVGAQLDHLAIDPGAHKTLAGQPLNDIPELAFLIRDHRGKEHDFRLRRQRQNFINNVRCGLACNGFARNRAVWLPNVSKKQSQKIVNLGCCRNDRAGIACRAALFDGNGGGEALDKINLRLFHLIEELPRVSGERFDIAALAFGIKGVERQRRFARAAQAGNHHQFVSRNRERQVF